MLQKTSSGRRKTGNKEVEAVKTSRRGKEAKTGGGKGKAAEEGSTCDNPSTEGSTLELPTNPLGPLKSRGATCISVAIYEVY